MLQLDGTTQRGFPGSGPWKNLSLPDVHPSFLAEDTGAGWQKGPPQFTEHGVLIPTSIDFNLC